MSEHYYANLIRAKSAFAVTLKNVLEFENQFNLIHNQYAPSHYTKAYHYYKFL